MYKYVDFKNAIKNGNLELLDRLIAATSLQKIQKFLKKNNYQLFNLAITSKSNDISMVKYLFELSEDKDESFIQLTLSNLIEQKQAYEATHPEPFDIDDPTQVKLLYLILKFLLNRADLNPHISLLLSLPAIKKFIALKASIEQNNEILETAIENHHVEAFQTLLSIPEVRKLAEEHNYYNAMNHDLMSLVANSESSMQPLTMMEQLCLKHAIDHYQPVIEAQTIPKLMQQLRKTLKKRYHQHPATILLDNGTEIELPTKFSAFSKLNLCKIIPRGKAHSEYQRALTAYYEHKDHTALRFILKPNPWVSPYARHVKSEGSNFNQKWSCFEEHQFLIVLFYLGAIDKNIVPIDNFTFDTRLEHFTCELAHIGRAHNWDSDVSHVILDGCPVVLDEYDDKEGDKPSCTGGIQSRLMQSVQGHPLFKVLTPTVMTEEIKDFVKQHFIKMITKQNYRMIKKNWDKCILGEPLSQEDEINLRALDVSVEKLTSFITAMGEKYKAQFTENPMFTEQIHHAFSGRDPHIITFGYVDIAHVLKTSKRLLKGNSSAFFKDKPQKRSLEEVAPTHEPMNQPNKRVA